MLPLLLRRGSTQAPTISPPLPSSFQPPGQRFLVLSGEKMLKLLAKWATKHPVVTKVRKVVFLVTGEGLFTGKGTSAFSGGCKVNTWMKSHCHLADLSVCAFAWLQLHLHEQQYCPKCRWRRSKRFPSHAMPDPLYAGGSENSKYMYPLHIFIFLHKCVHTYRLYLYLQPDLYI